MTVFQRLPALGRVEDDLHLPIHQFVDDVRTALGHLVHMISSKEVVAGTTVTRAPASTRLRKMLRFEP